MFNAVEKGWEASGDKDISFIEGTLLFVDMSEILMTDIFFFYQRSAQNRLRWIKVSILVLGGSYKVGGLISHSSWR
jgi:hypothetical protein